MTFVAAQCPPHPPPVASPFLTYYLDVANRNVECGRNNDAMRVVEFADLSNLQ